MSLPEPGSPADWLRHARSDLLLAEAAPPSGVLLEALCFHAQQAAEKAVEGVLIDCGVEPPYVHDINRLLHLLASHLSIPDALTVAEGLTPYATILRYPGDAVLIEEAEWREATGHARAVVLWAASVIEG